MPACGWIKPLLLLCSLLGCVNPSPSPQHSSSMALADLLLTHRRMSSSGNHQPNHSNHHLKYCFWHAIPLLPSLLAAPCRTYTTYSPLAAATSAPLNHDGAADEDNRCDVLAVQPHEKGSHLLVSITDIIGALISAQLVTLCVLQYLSPLNLNSEQL